MEHTTKIKICGITRVEDSRAAIALGADAIGVNFVKESPRYIGEPANARALIEQSGPGAKILWAGVFARWTIDQIVIAVRTAGLQIVQLHGDESPEFVADIKSRLPRGVSVWKAFRVATAADLEPLGNYPCDANLVDAKCAGVLGGSGQRFDWSLLKNISRQKPLVLAGGLGPDNVTEAVREVRPDWVDVASGVESKPGVKDNALVERFITAARLQTPDSGLQTRF
ncbi:MAG TPA: phosphoribosylanthranilate isomerase [Planctomycetota bacterium]|jgi:phosphoribosylanthranilate isomerase